MIVAASRAISRGPVLRENHFKDKTTDQDYLKIRELQKLFLTKFHVVYSRIKIKRKWKCWTFKTYRSNLTKFSLINIVCIFISFIYSSVMTLVCDIRTTDLDELLSSQTIGIIFKRSDERSMPLTKISTRYIRVAIRSRELLVPRSVGRVHVRPARWSR